MHPSNITVTIWDVCHVCNGCGVPRAADHPPRAASGHHFHVCQDCGGHGQIKRAQMAFNGQEANARKYAGDHTLTAGSAAIDFANGQRAVYEHGKLVREGDFAKVTQVAAGEV